MGEGRDVRLLPAAVSPLVAGEVAAAPRSCRVLAAFPNSVYLDLGAHERVLAVLAADAVALPIGVRLALSSGSLRWGVRAGDTVLVGEGRIRLPGADVVAARLLRPSRVRAAPLAPAGADLPASGVLGELVRDVAAAAVAGRPVRAGVLGLVGAGRGLTPSGDDALCGLLLVLAALGEQSAQRALAAISDAVRASLSRTTSISAALLVAASSGYAVPDVARLVTLLVGGGRDTTVGTTVGTLVGTADAAADAATSDASVVADLVTRVLAIGHTSGADLLAGVSGALQAVLESSPDPCVEPTPTPNEGAHRG